MGKFTEIELQDLIDGGNDFTRQLATQCLGAERQLLKISGLRRYNLIPAGDGVTSVSSEDGEWISSHFLQATLKEQ